MKKTLLVTTFFITIFASFIIADNVSAARYAISLYPVYPVR